MEDFHDIPVDLDGRSQQFTYSYLKDNDLGNVCTITSEGKTLMITEEYAVLNSDMPQEWVEPAIETLKRLLNQDVGLP